MKKVLLTLLVCLPVHFIFSQNCTPDPAYQDSTGVFPMPYHPVLSPDGGITECAVIGENYLFDFTVGVGDSITVVQNGLELRLELDKITITGVSGLPAGLNVLYDPPDGVFPANSIGCARLTGVPTDANQPGNFDMVISAVISFTSPLIPDYNATFPDSTFAPGTYTVVLLSDAGQPCDVAVATNHVLADPMAMNLWPNPTDGPVTVEVNSPVAGSFKMKIVDMPGRQLAGQDVRMQEGINTLPFDVSTLPNGLYFLVLENELGSWIQKMIIQH